MTVFTRSGQLQKTVVGLFVLMLSRCMDNMLETTYAKDTAIKKYLLYKHEAWYASGNWKRQSIFNDKGKAVTKVKRISNNR